MGTQVWVCTGVLPLSAKMQQFGYGRLAPFIVCPSLLKQPASRFQILGPDAFADVLAEHPSAGHRMAARQVVSTGIPLRPEHKMPCLAAVWRRYKMCIAQRPDAAFRCPSRVSLQAHIRDMCSLPALPCMGWNRTECLARLWCKFVPSRCHQGSGVRCSLRAGTAGCNRCTTLDAVTSTSNCAVLCSRALVTLGEFSSLSTASIISQARGSRLEKGN